MLAEMPAGVYMEWWWYYQEMGGRPDAQNVLLASLLTQNANINKKKEAPPFQVGDFYAPLADAVSRRKIKDPDDLTEDEVDQLADAAFGKLYLHMHKEQD